MADAEWQKPITVERLDWLAAEIQRSALLEGDTTLEEVRGFLDAIYEHQEYQDFLSHGQFQRSAGFLVPPDIIINHTPAFRMLSNPLCRLVSEHRHLEVKIGRHFGVMYLTDGYWISSTTRAFSSSEENQQLCSYIRCQGYEGDFDTLIDPACGSGLRGLALQFERRVCLDSRVRPITYTNLNRVLNNEEDWLVGLNDIRTGLPSALKSVGKNAIYAVNIPCSLIPAVEKTSPAAEQALAYDGHHRLSLAKATLSALGALWQTSKTLQRAVGVLLVYSLGRSKSGPWEIENFARKLLPGARLTLNILTGESICRVNGQKIAENPMPLGALEKKAECRLTWSEHEEGIARAGYQRLNKQLAEEGWFHLGCGLLEIELTRGGRD